MVVVSTGGAVCVVLWMPWPLLLAAFDAFLFVRLQAVFGLGRDWARCRDDPGPCLCWHARLGARTNNFSSKLAVNRTVDIMMMVLILKMMMMMVVVKAACGLMCSLWIKVSEQNHNEKPAMAAPRSYKFIVLSCDVDTSWEELSFYCILRGFFFNQLKFSVD